MENYFVSLKCQEEKGESLVHYEVMRNTVWCTENLYRVLTDSSESSASDNLTIGFLGITKKCVGAWGEISWNARHWRNRKQKKHNLLQRKVRVPVNQYAPLNTYFSRLSDTPNISRDVNFSRVITYSTSINF